MDHIAPAVDHQNQILGPATPMPRPTPKQILVTWWFAYHVIQKCLKNSTINPKTQKVTTPTPIPKVTTHDSEERNHMNAGTETKEYDVRPKATCTQGQPFSMVIPPSGATIECPIHPEGHRVKGQPAPRCS